MMAEVNILPPSRQDISPNVNDERILVDGINFKKFCDLMETNKHLESSN